MFFLESEDADSQAQNVKLILFNQEVERLASIKEDSKYRLSEEKIFIGFSQ